MISKDVIEVFICYGCKYFVFCDNKDILMELVDFLYIILVLKIMFFFVVVKFGRVDVVEMFFSYGVKVSVKDNFGWLLFFFVFCVGDIDMMKMLF